MMKKDGWWNEIKETQVENEWRERKGEREVNIKKGKLNYMYMLNILYSAMQCILKLWNDKKGLRSKFTINTFYKITLLFAGICCLWKTAWLCDDDEDT